MTVTTNVLKPGFAAEILGIDAANASDADIAALKRLSLEFPVIVLPDQHLSQEQQVAFGERFGPLDSNYGRSDYARGLRIDLLGVSNVDEDEKILPADDRRRALDMGNKFWHTDSSFKDVPAHLSMLYGVRVAKVGGETQFADLRAAWDTLSDDLKRVAEPLVALHSAVHARKMMGFDEFTAGIREELERQFAHDIVRVLPETGRKSLYLSSHASSIVGLPVPVGRVLLHELTEHATQPDNVYSHKWRTNDLAIWDNRCTLHRMRRYRTGEEARVLRRVTTLDPAFPARDPASVTVPDWLAVEAA